MREPAFWWRPAGLTAGLLAPFGKVYGAIAEKRMARTGQPASLPVLCVGNFTLGGAGKTPTAMLLARMLRAAGETPYFLTRGYGGKVTRPRLVDAGKDAAHDVGDEALLLARIAPTVVGRNRVVGAALAKSKGASVVVMDDGLQNTSLAKDITLAVIDGRRGIGNARVFPAGPLRAPLKAQLKRCDALLVIGDDVRARDVVVQAGALPVFHGRLTPDPAAVTALRTRKVLAFAGIGDPDKFFATVEQAGIQIGARRAFGDHHRYSAEDAAELVMAAEHDTLTLLTTEKDHARMAGEPALAALAAQAQVLPVTLEVDEMDALRALVLGKLRR
ncbi:MAG: tetraacyldisaccharide 4'-kinase [Pseudolabrys sp.]|nr:tetraacyldisaccharide 4'-kinase [Pseudolabrys sp.]MDP2298984.1 tetraacyldisaccharide 4'-kinase [Pseudolabrys sp.]